MSRLHVGCRRCIYRDTQRHISTTSVGGMSHLPPHLPCYMIFEELSRTSCNLTWPISLLKSDLFTTLKPGPPTSRRPRLPAGGSLGSRWVRVDRWAEGWLVGGGVLSRGSNVFRFQGALRPGSSLTTASSSHRPLEEHLLRGIWPKMSPLGKRPVGREPFVLEWARAGCWRPSTVYGW